MPCDNQQAAQPAPAARAESEYLLEVNPSEPQRLRMQHDIVKDAMGGNLIAAPIDLSGTQLRILDSATADGCWLEDVRQDYQLGNQGALVGTDIVPAYFPKPEALPQGMEFRVQSITAPWPDADKNSFDLVHQRMGLFATGAELEAAVAGLVDLVKPGGWIQLVDADLTGPEAAPDSPMAPSVRLIKTLLGKSLEGSDAYGARLKHIFKQNGLIAVEEKIVDARLGALNPNPALAKKSTTSFTLAAEGMVAAAKSMPTPWSDDLDDIVPKMRKGLEERGSLFRYWVVWGRKPL